MSRVLRVKLVWTNLLFFGSSVVAYTNYNLELTVLCFSVFVLSVAYHRNAEREYEMVEGFVAKLAFIYGIAQTFNKAPSQTIFSIELLLGIAILLTYICVGHLELVSYEPWHCLQHIFPGIYLFLVALLHEPLIF